MLGAAGAKVGIGTAAPQSLLQLGAPSSNYGNYLQLPTVSSASQPPASGCNNFTLVHPSPVTADEKTLRCVECGVEASPDAKGWQSHLGYDPREDE
ncbi:MAG: hypothetical protein C5B48_03730 [Candidatus Rokuibacteriota bacterium]|nr:MAG: hypothetical protein C5B48_03730 [Candidatus Rokubacteria bacterium]